MYSLVEVYDTSSSCNGSGTKYAITAADVYRMGGIANVTTGARQRVRRACARRR